MDDRPHPDKMMPFEWIYWYLVDNGDDRAAAGMREALSVIKMQHEDVQFERAHRPVVRNAALEEAAKVGGK